MSTAYSGIGAPEHAMQIFGRTMGFTCQPTSAYEKKYMCKAELRSMFAFMGSSTTCIFSDILDTVSSPDLRKACGLDGNKARADSAATLFGRDLHRANVSLGHVKCFCHNKKSGCSVRRAHIHIAGSMCTDHSTFGSCDGDDGEQAKVFLVWVAQRRRFDLMVSLPLDGWSIHKFTLHIILPSTSSITLCCLCCGPVISWRRHTFNYVL